MGITILIRGMGRHTIVITTKGLGGGIRIVVGIVHDTKRSVETN